MGADLPRSTAPIGAIVRRRRCDIFMFRAASVKGVDGQAVQARRAVYGRETPLVKVVGSVLRRFGICAPARIREGRDEAVADTRHGGDEAWVPIVVLELDAQAADMAVDDVALRDEVGPPDRVEDLIPREDAAAAAGEQIQKALFDPAQVDDGRCGPDLAVNDIDLHLAEPDGRDD